MNSGWPILFHIRVPNKLIPSNNFILIMQEFESLLQKHTRFSMIQPPSLFQCSVYYNTTDKTNEKSAHSTEVWTIATWAKTIRKKLTQPPDICFLLCFAGVRDIHYKASTILISSLVLEGQPSVSWCFGAEMICWLLTTACPAGLACHPTTRMEAHWWFQATECVLQEQQCPKVAQSPTCQRIYLVVEKKEKESPLCRNIKERHEQTANHSHTL